MKGHQHMTKEEVEQIWAEALVYYKKAGERTWRLTGWGQITFR